MRAATQNDAQAEGGASIATRENRVTAPTWGVQFREYPVRKAGRRVSRGDAGASFGAAGVIRWAHVLAPSRPGRPVAGRPEAAGRPAAGARGRAGGGEPSAP